MIYNYKDKKGCTIEVHAKSKEQAELLLLLGGTRLEELRLLTDIEDLEVLRY